MPIHRLKVT